AQGRDERLLPLDPGTEWVYDVERDGVSTRVTRRVMASTTLPEKAGTDTRVHQVFVRGGELPTFEYWSLDADGIHRHLRT
ncbi:hypothetical protein, partial [Streptomyces brasiliscabiei]|uniref:hypothetical protein n=1 Tax=Streptomyces brasiliscabiei TaxID=2736302 RepID=UPI0030149CAF